MGTIIKEWAEGYAQFFRTAREGGVTLCAKWAWDWFIIQGYAYDWITAGVVTIIGKQVPLGPVRPVDRYWEADDPTLNYPRDMSKDPVDAVALYMITFLTPYGIIALCAFILRSWADLHAGLLSIFWCYAVSCNIKNWMNLTGVLRPIWLKTKDDPTYEQGEGFLHESFPSGHAFYVSFAMMWVVLYLHGKLRVMQKPGPLHLVKAGFALLPLALSTWASCTRITRYVHSTADVTCGMFYGFIMGTFAYFIYYPSLWDSRCWLPTPRESKFVWPRPNGHAAHKMSDTASSNPKDVSEEHAAEGKGV